MSIPPSLQDWLPENHLARFVADVMNELDLIMNIVAVLLGPRSLQ